MGHTSLIKQLSCFSKENYPVMAWSVIKEITVVCSLPEFQAKNNISNW